MSFQAPVMDITPDWIPIGSLTFILLLIYIVFVQNEMLAEAWRERVRPLGNKLCAKGAWLWGLIESPTKLGT